MKKFKHLDRIADGMFQAYGSTLTEAFENSVYALIALMTKDKIKEIKKKKISVYGIDLKQLLYSFLEEILFLLDTENFIVSKVKNLKIKKEKKKYSLEADLYGDSINNYEIFGSVKAITYNDMFIKKINNKYVIQVVVDM